MDYQLLKRKSNVTIKQLPSQNVKSLKELFWSRSWVQHPNYL